MNHECKQESVLNLVVSKLDKLEEKIDTLLAWKWAIAGGSAVIAFAISVISMFIL